MFSFIILTYFVLGLKNGRDKLQHKSVDPAELSGRQSGTVTAVLNVCHLMKIVSTRYSYFLLHAFAEWVTGFFVIH